MRNRLLLAIIAALIAISSMILPVIARDRDPLAPVHDMEAHQFEAFPPNAISGPNGEAIVALVNEAREFGVPLAVRVVSLPTDHDALSGFNALDLSQPIPEETVHEMAQSWMADEPIESAPGAGDGFLMLVVMPEDHTLSAAVIEPGPNALPLNGITRTNIDEVIDTLVLPRFANNEVSQGIRSGLSVFSYNNLFGEPERLELDDLHKDLGLVASIPLAGATALSGVGLVALAVWISRRKRAVDAPTGLGQLSPFQAAALHEGRAGDAVIAGGLLELLRLGILQQGEDGSNRLRLDLTRPAETGEPFLDSIVSILRANADPQGVVSRAAMSRLNDIMNQARRVLEDDLARRGLFNKDGHVETMWMILASGLVGALALFTLLPSILSMAQAGILAILFALACIVGALVWATRRSWTTEHGRAVLEAWHSAPPAPRDRAIVDTIVHQDALISAQGGPTIPPTVSLARTLRGIGET